MATALLIALILPGVLVLRAMGARPAAALAGGPGLSVVAITAATVALPALGMRWTLGVAIILLLGICGLSALPLLWCWRRLRRAGGVSSGMRHGSAIDLRVGAADSSQDPAWSTAQTRPDSRDSLAVPPQEATGGAALEPGGVVAPVTPGEADEADKADEAGVSGAEDTVQPRGAQDAWQREAGQAFREDWRSAAMRATGEPAQADAGVERPGSGSDEDDEGTEPEVEAERAGAGEAAEGGTTDGLPESVESQEDPGTEWDVDEEPDSDEEGPANDSEIDAAQDAEADSLDEESEVELAADEDSDPDEEDPAGNSETDTAQDAEADSLDEESEAGLAVDEDSDPDEEEDPGAERDVDEDSEADDAERPAGDSETDAVQDAEADSLDEESEAGLAADEDSDPDEEKDPGAECDIDEEPDSDEEGPANDSEIDAAQDAEADSLDEESEVELAADEDSDPDEGEHPRAEWDVDEESDSEEVEEIVETADPESVTLDEAEDDAGQPEAVEGQKDPGAEGDVDEEPDSDEEEDPAGDSETDSAQDAEVADGPESSGSRAGRGRTDCHEVPLVKVWGPGRWADLDESRDPQDPESEDQPEPDQESDLEEESSPASAPDADDRLAPVTEAEADGVRRPGRPLVLRQPSTAGTPQPETWDWDADEELEPDWAPVLAEEPPAPARSSQDEEPAHEDATEPSARPASPLSRLGAVVGDYWRGSWREHAGGYMRDYWPAAVGLLAVAIPQIIVLSQAMGRPSAIFQNHDAMFHLNLIVEIERTGNASPLTSAVPVSGATYYPNLWHVLAAVLPGVPPTTAFNIVLIMVAALLLPLGCILLVRALGGGTVAMALAPFAASVTMWFPSLMLYFHGQASTALSIALIPFALAAIIEWVRDKTRFGNLCAAVAAVAGAAVGHVGAGQLLLVVCAVLGVLWSGRLVARRKELRLLARLAAPLPAVVGLLILAVMGSSPTLQAMGDYPRTDVPFGRALLNALILAPLADIEDLWRYIVLALSALIGLGLLIAKRHRTFVISWAVILTLDLISVLPEGWWRAYVGGWWRDEARFRAVLAVLAGVLAAYALGRLATWSAQRLRRGWGQRVVGVLGVLGLVLAVSSIGQGSLEEDSLWAHRAYDVDYMTHTPWVDPGEELFMDYLQGQLPDDAVVYGYPASGAGLLPVLTDIESFHRINSVGGDRQDKRYIARAFKEIRTDPRVCEIINNEGGTPLYYEDRTVQDREIKGQFPGYLDVDTSQGFELLATDGNASIWRITACDRDRTSR